MRDLIIKVIAKLLLIASVIVLIIGGFSVENDMGFAARMLIISVCMAAPDIIVWVLDGFYLNCRVRPYVVARDYDIEKE